MAITAKQTYFFLSFMIYYMITVIAKMYWFLIGFRVPSYFSRINFSFLVPPYRLSYGEVSLFS